MYFYQVLVEGFDGALPKLDTLLLLSTYAYALPRGVQSSMRAQPAPRLDSPEERASRIGQPRVGG